jgi:hypothetical protein
MMLAFCGAFHCRNGGQAEESSVLGPFFQSWVGKGVPWIEVSKLHLALKPWGNGIIEVSFGALVKGALPMRTDCCIFASFA